MDQGKKGSAERLSQTANPEGEKHWGSGLPRSNRVIKYDFYPPQPLI